MFTFLHHSDPTIPHYRKNAWTFLRGAAATVDRPLLGWAGRFFFHNISHDHVAHRKLQVPIHLLFLPEAHRTIRQISSFPRPSVSFFQLYCEATLLTLASICSQRAPNNASHQVSLRR